MSAGQTKFVNSAPFGDPGLDCHTPYYDKVVCVIITKENKSYFLLNNFRNNNKLFVILKALKCQIPYRLLISEKQFGYL